MTHKLSDNINLVVKSLKGSGYIAPWASFRVFVIS
jgi:hypothetical protein